MSCVRAYTVSLLTGRSQSIRPMPRYLDQAERILEQLNTVRESIAQLNQQISQVSYASFKDLFVVN